MWSPFSHKRRTVWSRPGWSVILLARTMHANFLGSSRFPVCVMVYDTYWKSFKDCPTSEWIRTSESLVSYITIEWYIKYFFLSDKWNCSGCRYHLFNSYISDDVLPCHTLASANRSSHDVLGQQELVRYIRYLVPDILLGLVCWLECYQINVVSFLSYEWRFSHPPHPRTSHHITDCLAWSEIFHYLQSLVNMVSTKLTKLVYIFVHCKPLEILLQ